MTDYAPIEPDEWRPITIYDFTRQPDGTFTALLDWATTPQGALAMTYYVRGYQKDGNVVRMEVQVRQTAADAAAWQKIVNRLEGRLIG
jgi:hypothetical protein